MLRIRLMTVGDVPLGLRLSAQAGWNQLEADWRRALGLQPDGCLVAEQDGFPVGTTTTCIFDSIAWIAMVLVDASCRGGGIGTALMKHALAFLGARGVRSVRLDATPLGRPLYLKLGFVEEYALTRYDGQPASGVASGPRGQEAPTDRTAPDLATLAALDRAITGTNRTGLLRALLADNGAHLRWFDDDQALAGFLLSRPGAKALHIGPCLGSPTAGQALLADALARHAGQRVFVDVPDANRPAVALAQSAGLQAQRPLYRMCRGPAPAEDPTRIWATFGPEKG